MHLISSMDEKEIKQRLNAGVERITGQILDEHEFILSAGRIVRLPTSLTKEEAAKLKKMIDALVIDAILDE